LNIEAKLLGNLETINRRRAVCTVSGGLDSAVSAAVMSYLGLQTDYIFFDWGQKTYKKELECAQILSEHYKTNLIIVEVPLLKKLPSISLTESETFTTKINEYVPNRNSILESQAVAYAEFLRAGVVCVGSTGGDHICPDNSPRFLEIMQQLISQGTMLKPPIRIVAPLMDTDKTGAVKLGHELGVPFEHTWSCHNNNDLACGLCSNCEARIEAFHNNDMIDPIPYVDNI
jgi:7-cyano-7-deazaguanine synthase